MADADYKPGEEVEALYSGCWETAECVATDREAVCVRLKDSLLRIFTRERVRRPVPKPQPRLKTVAVQMEPWSTGYAVGVFLGCVHYVSPHGLTATKCASEIDRILPQEGGNDPELESRLREAMAQHNQQTKENEA